MKFQYKNYGRGVVRPVIPIEVIYKDRVFPYEVLVDSGADMCVFDLQIAEILGINLTKTKQRTFISVSGDAEFYYIHNVNIKVGNKMYSTNVGFVKNISALGYGIVGQRGFFDIFTVKFDLLREEIELKERETKTK